jgi:hypothetical protein
MMDWQKKARESGLGQYQIDTLTKMFTYYNNHGFVGNQNILTLLLKRPPTSFADFIDRTIRKENE